MDLEPRDPKTLGWLCSLSDKFSVAREVAELIIEKVRAERAYHNFCDRIQQTPTLGCPEFTRVVDADNALRLFVNGWEDK